MICRLQRHLTPQDFDPKGEHGDGSILADERAWPGDDVVAERLADYILQHQALLLEVVNDAATARVVERNFPWGFDPYER